MSINTTNLLLVMFILILRYFQGNGYLKSFIDKCFKKFLDRLHVIKPTSATSITLFVADFFTSQNQNKNCYEKHFKLL